MDKLTQSELFQLFAEAQDLSADILDFAQSKVAEPEKGVTEHESLIIKASFAICFATLCKATDTSMHKALEMVMSVYKNTVVDRHD